ncbi:class I SAM-dependent methyltransferase [Candidatus Lucifugimonas marina]
MALDEYRAVNRDNWDDRVPIHLDSDEYMVQKFIDDPEHISEVVQFDLDNDELGDLRGKSLLHLQCHIGHDTISWARLGANVTGLDFSEPAIEACRRLVTNSGTPGEFVVAEVFDAPAALDNRQFDVVYTGVGAICWLPDINGWAKIVAQLLKPGGTFYILEGHPMMWSVSQDDHGHQIVLDWPYFESAGPQGYEEDTTYAGEGTLEHKKAFNIPHGLGETIDALLQAGLVLDFVHEHKALPWQAFPMMVKSDAGRGLWKMPDGKEDFLPLAQSIKAHKPE